MILYVLSGLPGAGKTTKALELADQTYSIIISRDEQRTSYRNKIDENHLTIVLAEQARYLLSQGYDVIVDSWNLTQGDEDLWFCLAADVGSVIQWIHIKTPVDVCVERDSNRPEGIGAHNVRAAAEEFASRLTVLSEV